VRRPRPGTVVEAVVKRSVRVLPALFLAFVALPACASGIFEKKFRVGFMPGVDDPFYHTMEKGIRAKARELGMNVVVGNYPVSWDPDTQIPSLQALIAKGRIDLLLIAPASPTALVAPLEALRDRGTAIVTVATYLGDDLPVASIGTDNTLGGKLVAEHLAGLIGEKGKVYVMNVNPDVVPDVERGAGFQEGIAEFPNMRIVGMDFCRDDPGKAAELTRAALVSNPDIAGIFAVDESAVRGVTQAVRSAALSGVVKVASWDATQALIESLKRGELDLVVTQLPAEMGSLGIDAGYRYLSAKTLPPKKIVPGFQFITIDNVGNPDMQQYVYSR
jgi:ribose transport system substrate-binding protein